MATSSSFQTRRSVLQDGALSLLSSLDAFPLRKLTPSCKSRLAKLLRAELCFLRHLCPNSQASALKLTSTNLCYLEALIQVLQHPLVDGASSVLQTFPITPSENLAGFEAHVDIVCTFNGRPVWFVVSARNPKYIHWLDDGHRKGFQSKVSFLLNAAVANVLLQPAIIFFCFAKGVSDCVAQKLQTEYGALKIRGLEWELEKQNADKSCEMFQEVEDGEWINTCLDTVSVSAVDESWEIFEEVEEGEWINIFSFNLLSTGTENVHSRSRIWAKTLRSTSFDSWAVFQIEREHFCHGLKGFKLPDSVNEEIDLSLAFCSSEIDKFSGTNEEEDINLAAFSHMLLASCLSSLTLPYGSAENLSNFSSLLGFLRWHKKQLTHENRGLHLNLINLDTTAVISLVSDVSNGQAQKILNMSREELRQIFRNTADFMKDQAESELKKPLLWEMIAAISHRRPFVSQFVFDEVKSLVLMCGSSREKQRANELFQLLMVLPSRPSVRVMSLPESGRIKEKNKIIFGTGDSWNAPTLTANMAFVRAARQTGMALSVIEHRPRALVGDKCS